MRLLFLLFFISLNSYSQRIYIEDQESLKSVVFDSINNECILYYQEHYEKINMETFERKSFKLFVKGVLSHPMIIDNVNYFVDNGGGMVSILKNDTIKRIDRSFNHLMQHGSIVFAYKSKIYKYGGYGFWSNRNFFTYFDDKTKEWEVVDPINSESIPDGSYAGMSILDGDDFYVFNGQKINPYRRKERILSNEVWKFNLKDHQWKYLGASPSISVNYKIRSNKKILIKGEDAITEIDIINNRITVYEHGLFSSRLEGNLPIYLSNNKIYCFINERGKIYFHGMDQKSFFGKEISNKIFYKNYSWWITLTLLFILLPIAILFVVWRVYKFYKKQKKIVLLDNGSLSKNYHLFRIIFKNRNIFCETLK
ncbi:MAG: hypothetical protein GQ552_00870 [Flavobacteriaceae bacterium]|nr:hypothetical protein [Flavobacteriaceae bacterium]